MNIGYKIAALNKNIIFGPLITFMTETGTVKFFNELKGFGFITSSKGTDYFIHISALNGTSLSNGKEVSFQTRQGKKGLEAFNVSELS